jgi:hypothetical protein
LQELITEAPNNKPLNMQNNLNLNAADRFIVNILTYTSFNSKSAPSWKIASYEPFITFLKAR